MRGPPQGARQRTSTRDMESCSFQIRAAELQAELRQLATAIRRKRKQIRQPLRNGARRQTILRRASLLRKKVLAIYQLAGHDAEPAAAYLQGHGLQRKPRGPMRTDDEAVVAVENLYLAADDTECSSAVAADCSDGFRNFALRAAAKYLVEYRIFHWVLTQNCDRGVAPSTRTLLQQIPGLLPGSLDVATADDVLASFDPNCRRGRMWACRWRRRWGLRLGQLPLREPQSQKELQDKVTPDSFLMRAHFRHQNHIPGPR